MLRHSVPVLLVTFTAILAGCSGQQSDMVAVVGDHSISITEFESGFAQQPQSFTSYSFELERRREFLVQLVDQKLLVIGAYRQGLDKDQEIQRLIEQQQSKFLLDQLYKSEIAGNVDVTDAEVQTWYEHMGEEIHARHVLVDSEEEANEIKAEFEGGADFAKLAQERSNDPSAQQNAGDLSWFRWGTMVQSFQETAFALDSGEVGEPVQTQFGWHVIQLLGRREVDRQPFDQVEPAIRNQMKQQKEQARLREFLAGIRDKTDLRLDMDMLTIVQETYRDTTGGPLPFKSNLDANDLNIKLQLRPIARDLDTSLAAGDFVRMANQAPPVNRPNFYDTTAIKEFMFQMIYTTVLEREARRLRIDQSDDYKLTLRKFRETLMADKMKDDLVQRPVDVTTEMLTGYYDDHPEEFSSPPTVHIREALIGSEEEGEQIIQRVRRGAKFDEICTQVTLRPGMKGRRGDLGTFRRFEYPALFDAAQRMDVGQVGGPIYHATQGGAQWSVVELLAKKDAETRTFEAVEQRILTKLRNEMRQQALTDWLAEMHESTRVQINEQILASTVDRSKYPEEG